MVHTGDGTAATAAGDDGAHAPFGAAAAPVLSPLAGLPRWLPPALSCWQVIGKIGQGSFGIVVSAQWADAAGPRPPGIAEFAAIKMALGGDARVDALVLQEALVLKGLDLPGVVTVYDAFRDPRDLRPAGGNDRPAVLVMELASCTLEQHLRARGQEPIDIRDADAIALEVVRALAQVHQAGHIHNDLKPNNVLRCGDRWKLSDLGLTLALDEGTHVSNVPFNERLQPPDLRSSTRVRKDWDVWALGLLLHRVYAGRDARPGEDPRTQAANGVSGILDIDPAIEPGRRQLIERCLATSRALASGVDGAVVRYADAEEVLADLIIRLGGARPVVAAAPPAFPTSVSSATPPVDDQVARTLGEALVEAEALQRTMPTLQAGLHQAVALTGVVRRLRLLARAAWERSALPDDQGPPLHPAWPTTHVSPADIQDLHDRLVSSGGRRPLVAASVPSSPWADHLERRDDALWDLVVAFGSHRSVLQQVLGRRGVVAALADELAGDAAGEDRAGIGHLAAEVDADAGASVLAADVAAGTDGAEGAGGDVDEPDDAGEPISAREAVVADEAACEELVELLQRSVDESNCLGRTLGDLIARTFRSDPEVHPWRQPQRHLPSEVLEGAVGTYLRSRGEVHLELVAAAQAAIDQRHFLREHDVDDHDEASSVLERMLSGVDLRRSADTVEPRPLLQERPSMRRHRVQEAFDRSMQVIRRSRSEVAGHGVEHAARSRLEGPVEELLRAWVVALGEELGRVDERPELPGEHALCRRAERGVVVDELVAARAVLKPLLAGARARERNPSGWADDAPTWGGST